MTDRSPRLALPLLAAGQAQKEVVHNEALALLDALVQPVATAAGVNHPPTDPEPGQCWIVGETPDGAWAGQAHAIAVASAGGWRFAAAAPGMALWLADTGMLARRTVDGWELGVARAAELRVAGVKVVGERQASVPNPSGGAVIDAEARTTIANLLSALRNHGLISS